MQTTTQEPTRGIVGASQRRVDGLEKMAGRAERCGGGRPFPTTTGAGVTFLMKALLPAAAASIVPVIAERRPRGESLGSAEAWPGAQKGRGQTCALERS